ncbi:putative cytochrome P450 6a14 [Calliopsis andreniformis]|uniref:putative cytochrome P450 6a14 n=1 Tax=Calliopsis andreniformis TaxID=337506 RepID=UPI003FCE306C
MAWLTLESLGLFAVIFFLLYYYGTSTFDFWKKRGVKGPQPLPFVGNFKDVFLGTGSVSDCFTKAYYDFKSEQLVGIFRGRVPLLVVKDPHLMKDILIKDFHIFGERNLTPQVEVEPLSAHLFRLDIVRWKPLRTRFSSVFSSGKLKEMFHLLLECADHFGKYLDEVVAKGEPVECHEISAKFTTDVIGSCAFGIEMNALADENSKFRKMGRKVFETSWRSALRDRLRDNPFLFRIFGRFVVDQDVVDFFTDIIKQTINYRIKNNVHRQDFVDTLVDLKQHPQKLGLKEVNDIYAAAQAFVFFIAGFESSSVTISNALYELALNPSIQEKVRAEIKDVLKKNNGSITYDCLQEMKYLNTCLQETLRKYPVILYLSRVALADYTFAGTKVTIPKGQNVFLPVYGIHQDPEIYPKPEVFDPDRFMDGNDQTIHPMHYLPFGDGPRNCIAARFAKNQSKVALVTILSKFKVEVCEETQIPYILDKRSLFILQPAHGIHIKMTKLEE